MDASALGRIIDRQAIVDTVVRWAQSLDAKDWPGARSCFTDEIETDYTTSVAPARRACGPTPSWSSDGKRSGDSRPTT